MSTSKKKRSIVLFEDRQARIDELTLAIKPLLGSKFELKVFPLHEAPKSDEGPYEDRLVTALGAPEFGDIVLVVTDRDLSTQKWGGLSEAAVTRAAQELGLPVACYRQAKTYLEDEFKRHPGNGQLELPNDANARAKRIITICNGFLSMEQLVDPKPKAAAKIGKPPAKNAKAAVALPASNESPGTMLARILGKPDIGMQIDLFACGDQRTILEILKASEGDVEKVSAKEGKRLVVALGVWLADLVMVYPGLLLNEVAAASYLDIHVDDFKKPKVRALFEKTIYGNKLPFSDEESPMWWRHELDELINQAGAISGLDLCKANRIKVRFCPCSVNPELHAGYYCMGTRAALSDEESSGRVSWFPIGADLARLTQRTQRALAPWIGS